MKFLTMSAIATACLVLPGCASNPASTALSPVPTAGGQAQLSRLTLLATDYSKSTERTRSILMTTSFDFGTTFNQQFESFRLYRFGHSVEEVYSQLPEDDDDFAMILVQNLKQSDPIGGTNYALMLESLANAADLATEAEVRICIVGDGENDFRGDAAYDARYRAAAARLAKNPRVKLVRFWGVNTGTREEIRSVFRPLGQRLQILSLDQNPLAP